PATIEEMNCSAAAGRLGGADGDHGAVGGERDAETVPGLSGSDDGIDRARLGIDDRHGAIHEAGTDVRDHETSTDSREDGVQQEPRFRIRHRPHQGSAPSVEQVEGSVPPRPKASSSATRWFTATRASEDDTLLELATWLGRSPLPARRAAL